MPKQTRTLTIDGHKYRVSAYDWWPGVLYLNGPGIVGGTARASDLTLDSAELRAFVVTCLAEYRANRERASAAFQQKLRDGMAGPAFM